MDTVIVVAVVLIASGVLVSLFLWLRHPGPRETEYVTVAELRARLQHEHDDPKQPAESPTAMAAADTAEPGTVAGIEDTTGNERQDSSSDVEEAARDGAEPEAEAEMADEPGGSAAELPAADGTENGDTGSADPTDSSAEQHPDR